MFVAVNFLIIMFLLYNYLLFELIDTLLENPKLKKKYRILIALLNTGIAFLLAMKSGRSSVEAYLLIAVVLLIEFIVFYRDKISRCVFCMLSCVIHVMVIRALCVSFFAIALDCTIFEVVDDTLMLVVSTGITFMLLNIAVFLVNKLIPAKGIKIINQHKEQLFFMTTCLVVFCGYLLINAGVYDDPNNHPMLLINQIAAPTTILIGIYIILFFSFKTSGLLGYKEKTEELEHTVEKERQYRMTIDKDVFRIIEVNYTKNELLSGFEEYEEKLGDTVHNYSEMLAFMIQETVHPDDRGEFLKYSSPLTIVEEFEKGMKEIIFDYRRLMPEGNYVWMQVVMVFFKDESNGEIKGFVQIKNIDKEKKKKIDLEYKAERDLLTALYNKGTTEKLIAEYLMGKADNSLAGVLFVIDIDNFKAINDNLGHLYGDAVLSELSESLRTIFRDNDIVGRIGGDEFLVFAKGTIGLNRIIDKANAICKAFLRTYTNDLKQDYIVSSSIGIAMVGKDGINFEMLFKAADAALYATKARGKNGYSFYENDFEQQYVSTRTEIDTRGNLQKNFKDNRIEYVFRLLYGSEDSRFGIESVLELIAKNFQFSRANIFEFNEKSTVFNGVFEWCARGIPSVSENYINVPISNFDFVIHSLEKAGGMFMATPMDFPAHAQQHYEMIGIKSILHFSIKENDKLIGVIAFQNCTNNDFQISEEELAELRVICQVLSVFMSKQLGNYREQKHHEAIEAVMDNMNSLAYVIDIETYEIFYENQNVVRITGNSSVGSKCHCAYRGFDAPCEDCALNSLTEEVTSCTLELYTEKFDLYTQTTGTLIDWDNGRRAMLLSSVDITEYKRKQKEREEREKEGINENFDKQLNELISRTKIGTWDWEIKTGKVVYGESWAEVLGYTKEELPQTVETWEKMVLPEDLVYANEQIERHFRGETPIYEAEFRMICKDGSIIWAQDKGNVSEVDEEGNPVRFVGVLQDVSRIKNAEMLLKENQETLDLAVNVAELGTWDWDIPNNKIQYNDEYLHMLGLTQSDMNGSLEEWESTNHPMDLPNTIKALNSYMAGITPKYECEMRMKHKDGHFIWTRDIGRIVARDAEGNPTRLIGGHLNIDALKRSQNQLNKLAYQDELTGLPNLAKFKIDAKEMMEQHKEKSFVFMKLDIINFKIVNDMFGKEVGDLVIRKVGEIVENSKEQGNLELGSLARVHDDVFILMEEVFGESVGDIDERTRIFEQIFQKEMEEVLGNHCIKFRYGRYFAQKGDTDVDYAIECATLALSKAKANTTSNIFDFDVHVKDQIRREVELSNKMQKGLVNKEFVVYLQGKYSLIDESLCGAEALARWKVDEDTIISPSEFIPLFEQNGSIIKLDLFMFTQCCGILADWKKQGLPLIPISVNFSRQHISNLNFAEEIADIAKTYDIDPKYLEIELTETMIVDLDDRLLAFIESVHEKGFPMSIDDFGTGYSSLGMLKNVNVDTIKIDRSFFVDAQENAKAHSVLSNMINMIIDLGIKSVAEGVEERAHVDLLRKLNCDMIQGHYFGKAIPVREFTQKIYREVNIETITDVNDKLRRFNLRKNNELLIDMMDSMPLAFTLWDKNIKIVQCNKEAVSFLGFKTEDEMIAKVLEAIPEYQPDGQHSLETLTKRIQLAFEYGYGNYPSWYLQHSDGTLLPCEVILVRIVNKGEFMVASYVRDLRLQMEQEKSAKQEQLKMQALIDATPMCVGLWDANSQMLMCNSAAATLFELDSRQDYVENFYDFSPEYQPCGKKTIEMAKEYMKSAFESGFVNFTWMHQNKKGETIPAEITLVGIKLNGESVIAGFTRDMRKQIADEERSGRILSSVLEHMNSMAYIIEPKTFRILYENEAMAAFTGNNGLGKLCYETFRGEDAPCEECPLIGLSEEQPKTSIECYNKKYDMHTKALGSFVEWVDGKKAALVNVIDMGEYKQLLDASPICINVWNSNEKLIMCNKAARAMFDIESEKIYLERFHEFSPAYQPDGKSSQERIKEDFEMVRKKGVYSFGWMHQKLNGDPVFTEVTLVQITLNKEPMIAAFIRDIGKQ